MTRRSFDVDIDVSSSTKKDRYGIRSFVYNSDLKKAIPHPSGYFIESNEYIGYNIPIDKQSGLSSMDTNEGEEYGFFKVDLLTNTTYDHYKTKEEVLNDLDFSDFDWSLFQNKDIVERLPHLSKHFSIVRQLQPQSVEDVADILALIRPGKIDLYDDYLKDKERTRKRLYKKPQNGEMYFKKSHSIAYAFTIMIANKGILRNDINHDMFGIS